MRLHSAFLQLAAAVVATTDEALPVGQPSSLGVYNSEGPVQTRIRTDQSVNEERQGRLASVGLRPSRLINEMEALHAAWGKKFPDLAQAWTKLDAETSFLSVAQKHVFFKYNWEPDMDDWDSVISFMKGLDEHVVVSTINTLSHKGNRNLRYIAFRMGLKWEDWCAFHGRPTRDVFRHKIDNRPAEVKQEASAREIADHYLSDPHFDD